MADCLRKGHDIPDLLVKAVPACAGSANDVKEQTADLGKVLPVEALLAVDAELAGSASGFISKLCRILTKPLPHNQCQCPSHMLGVQIT